MQKIITIFLIFTLTASCQNSQEIVRKTSVKDTFRISLCDTAYFDCDTDVYGKLKDTLPDGTYLVSDYNEKTGKETLILESKYQNKVRNGIETEYYYENSKVLKKTSYKNGLKDGNSILITPLGDTSHNFNYKKGLTHGVCSYWEEGNFFKGYYENDSAEGEWKVYSQDKKLIEIHNYKKDSLVEVIKITE